jgi:(1->4)-alpha-D-glucan 1-alpha-D-glucosylmutase
MAKGVEDCAFYRWSRLTSLNEVGGDPSIFAIPPAEFHDHMGLRQADWPHAMVTLSTHDTKRGEDVRARITALAEIPDEWATALDELLALAPLPDAGFASLLWQAVLGSWPASRERLHGYAEKAMREAGDRTTWTEPDEDFEAAVHAAVDAAHDDERVRAVLERLLARVVAPGWSNALAAKLLSITVPGVPDVYQGSELWEQSLVDPDNRRFVDFDLRAAALGALAGGERPGLGDAADDPGTAKLLVTREALTLRRERPELFTSYAGVAAHGAAADHVLAFDRGGALTVVTRMPLGLAARGGWDDTTLALGDGTWHDVVSGRTFEVAGGLAVGELLTALPVALLVREDA